MFDHHSASYADSGSRGSSRSLSWQEMRHKRNENRRYDWDGEHSGSGEGSSQTYQSASKIPEQKHRDRRDQEPERLHRLVRDLELEVHNRDRKRNHD